ncbi:hypothetical protein [Salinisphaera sp. G21_0]|uniref:hypothetical protein n=1 Tax=Salinisphaera sp. G21_0 TaxID=2821094 RepID=UPI001AD99611|nr:hypothetical protein [Salinisphaera sp. G21_0]MBO9482448.1 hypothetical protein [Salinisphaera sp. G21_0]
MHLSTTGRNENALYTFANESGSDGSALLTDAVSKTFQDHIKLLPEGRRGKTIQEMLRFVNRNFPGEIVEFERSLRDRGVALAEDSSETGAVSIHPMGKLLDKYKCFELPEHLNSLVENFNSELTRLINIEEDTEAPPTLKKREMKRSSESMVNFGRYILEESSLLCNQKNCGGSTYSDCAAAARETKNNLESWHKSIKFLCDGVFDPLLAEPGSPDYNDSDKSKAIDLLKKMEVLMQTNENKYYVKIDKTLGLIKKGIFRDSARSYLTGSILEHFIGSRNLVVFQKTMQMLFEYYQFTPEPAFIEILPKLNDIIKSYSEKTSRY